MEKRYILLLLLLSFLFPALFGQESYEEWKRRQDAEFNEFLSKEDQEFSEFLRNEWEQFQAFKAAPRDPEPKPVAPPSLTPGYTKESAERAGKFFGKRISVPTNPPAAPDISEIQREYRRASRKQMEVPFLGGTKLYFTDPGKPELRVRTPLTNQIFSDAWLALSEWDYAELLDECKNLRNKAKLNDWVYFRLLSEIGNGMYPDNSPAADIVSWFLLIKSGYDVRIGYSADGNEAYLLLPAGNMIYDVLYFYFNSAGPYYYFFKKGKPARNVGSFYTYTRDNPEGDKSVDMKIREVPAFTDDRFSRTFTFLYKGETYSIEIEGDKNIVSVGEGYPQTDLDIYFSTPVAMNTRHSLVGSLKIVVDGLSETETVNLLLRFVQTAFNYQTDQQQFGYEKPMFVEESLFYPYCDCEDRSVLFSYLVKEITGLDVIALDYPGHIATAVRFSKPVSGDSVNYKGNRYVICDPTYINADIGMAMPRYRTTRPGVIEVIR